MGEIGTGYFISLKNKTAIVISGGFSYKETGYEINYGSTRYLDYKFKYYYRRIAIRLGIKI